MNKPQVNVEIELRPDRLDRQLSKIRARQLHSVIALVSGIPTDVSGVVIRIFRPEEPGHYEIPVSRRGNGSSGIAYAIGTCFPSVGKAAYEVHATDANGNPTALGAGEVEVLPFSQTGTPVTPGASVPVMQIADSTGALHTITAVPDGMGNYTTILDA